MSDTPKLYDYWRSSASYRVRIALNLLGIAYEAAPVDLLTKAWASNETFGLRKSLEPRAPIWAIAYNSSSSGGGVKTLMIGERLAWAAAFEKRTFSRSQQDAPLSCILLFCEEKWW